MVFRINGFFLTASSAVSKNTLIGTGKIIRYSVIYFMRFCISLCFSFLNFSSASLKHPERNLHDFFLSYPWSHCHYFRVRHCLQHVIKRNFRNINVGQVSSNQQSIFILNILIILFLSIEKFLCFFGDHESILIRIMTIYVVKCFVIYVQRFALPLIFMI